MMLKMIVKIRMVINIKMMEIMMMMSIMIIDTVIYYIFSNICYYYDSIIYVMTQNLKNSYN